MKDVKRDNRKAYFVEILAEKHNLTRREVYRILEGTRTNEDVFSDYMDLLQGTNALVNAVKNLVPFN